MALLPRHTNAAAATEGAGDARAGAVQTACAYSLRPEIFVVFVLTHVAF